MKAGARPIASPFRISLINMHAHSIVCILLLLTSCAWFALTGASAMASEPVRITLNSLEITLDKETGCLLGMSYPGLGILLESTPERAGMLDLAYPVKDFEPLRLASRYSTRANVTATKDAVVIYWNKIGASRNCFPVEGDVAATVRLVAAPDGKSIIFSCEINNQSRNDIRQVLFPDLSGILPFCGADKMILRTAQYTFQPFLELAPNEEKLSLQYMIDTAAFSTEYQSGGIFNTMCLRWLDFGGLLGGISLFQKRWGWDAPMTVRVHLSEVEQKLRMMCRHDVTIKSGEKWKSPEYWLTPHTGGWAKGIEPFRAWVRRNYKREFSLPKHVRDGLGYRTVWMCQSQPNDPQDAIFTFKDLPELAKESIEHGIDEIVLWGWTQAFERPVPPPFLHLGTEKEMVDAIRECRKLGVNVAPFISVLQATAENAPRYGLQVHDNNGWTYHTELIPRWNPPYATGMACVGIPTSNELWQKEVLESCKHLVDIGIPSLGWDQYWTTTADTPNMQSLTSAIRSYSRKSDPESTFSGEELWNFEIDSAYLDYTWNWGGYRDCRALTSVLPTPRLNACISESAMAVKKSFADSIYLNVFPRKKESINGSDLIVNHPELSKALKQCAKLRKQFLPYFTEGTLIGECILANPCPGAHITAYTRPDSVLMILINEYGKREVEFKCDLASWLPSPTDSYKITRFNEDGKPVDAIKASATWSDKTPVLEQGEMTVYEICVPE